MNMFGTVGKSKRLEAIKMKLDLGSYDDPLNMQLIQEILMDQFCIR